MNSLRLTMLGGFEVCDSAGRRITFNNVKAGLLLAYLALRPGQAHSRDNLMALLWSDRDDSHARGSLRQSIWALRRALEAIEPAPVTVDSTSLTLDQTAVDSDVASFERLAGGTSLADLDAAVSRYRGDLLEGVKVTDSGFEDFLRDERMRLQALAIDAATGLLDRQLEAGLVDKAAATAKRLLEIDPLQEAAHRTLMQHYARNGQASLAFKQYHICCDAYRRELNVEPGAETTRLFDRIRFAHLASEDSLNRSDTIARPHHDDRASRLSGQDKPSIAVLPFTNLSGDPEQEYFSDGITEDIITALSRLRWFLVIARNSTFVFKGTPVDVRQVGRELGVRYVLEGSVRKSGRHVRVTVELVDTVDGVQHWAQRYDYELTDIFKLQDEIAESVTAALEPRLVAAEGIRSLSRPPTDLGAWDLVTRALSHYGRMTTEDSDKAIDVLHQAVRQYPDYGPAHSLLAFALLVSGHVGWIPEGDDYRYAAELAHRALRLDDEDPWAHLALGYLAFTERRTGESVSEFMRALDLNPNFATAYGYLGWALVFDGQSEEAIRYFERALRMSPRDPLKAFFYSGTCVAHYYARRYDEAIKWGRKAITERPGFSAAHRILCAALAQAGRIEETRVAMEELRRAQPNVSIAWIEEHVPYTPRAMPHFLDGMRKAGLE